MKMERFSFMLWEQNMYKIEGSDEEGGGRRIERRLVAGESKYQVTEDDISEH